jgi:hypothetical protein
VAVKDLAAAIAYPWINSRVWIVSLGGIMAWKKAGGRKNGF